jgi:hypothetical protein
MHNTARLLSSLWLPAALGCGTVIEDPYVDYGDAKPLGSWSPATAQTTFETEGLEADPDQDSTSIAGSPAIATAPATTRPTGTGTTAAQGQKGSSAAAGAPAAGSAGAAAPSGTAKPAAGAAGAAAPSGGPETETEPKSAEPEQAAGVTKLEFSYTTESLGGRYAPKNVGAIWVSDSSGKLVKSLEVWARVRLRYLTSYASARGSARPDVTATATLTNHKSHTASWDLKDTTGAAVAPGKYTLHAELTDNHMTGKTIMIPFDTSAGATIEPEASPGFMDMKLVLQ